MPNLGVRLRELRQQRGLTLEQVAEESGLSVSFLSMVERDKVSISVDNLERLAHYYEVHMVHFFSGPDESPVLVTRREEILKRIDESGKIPAMVTLLANRPNARLEPLLVHIAPGMEEPHFRKHEADTLVYILEGQARLLPEYGEELMLEQGDMAYYVNFPHRRFANASAENPLLLIVITAPPTSTLDELIQARQGAWMMGNQNNPGESQ